MNSHASFEFVYIADIRNDIIKGIDVQKIILLVIIGTAKELLLFYYIISWILNLLVMCDL